MPGWWLNHWNICCFSRKALIKLFGMEIPPNGASNWWQQQPEKPSAHMDLNVFFPSRSGFPYQESTKVGVLLYLKPLILEWCVKLWESFDQKNRWWWPKFLFISMPRFPYVRDGFTKGIKKQQLVLLVRGRVEYGLYIVFLCEHVLQKNEHVWFQL